MKNILLKRCASITAFLILATQLMIPVYATENISSANSGTGSTTSTTNSSGSSCKTGDSNCKESSSVPATSQSTSSTPKTSTTTAPTTTSITTSTGAVDATKVINSTTSATTDTAVNSTVDAVIKVLEGASDSTAVKTLENVEQAVKDKINKLNVEAKKDPKKRVQLLKEIANLKKMQTQVRIKTFETNKKVVDKIKKIVHRPTVYEIRWGNLNNKTKVCTKVSTKELTDSLDKNQVPEKCLEGIKKVDYTGKIGVSIGTLKVQKKVLFEANDKVTVASGSAIGFESVIAGHWDGLIVDYLPTSTTSSTNDVQKNEIEITISLGDLNQTFKGSEVLGRKKIGNGHFIEIKPLINVLPGLTQAVQDRALQHKLNIQDKLSDLRKILQRLRLLNKGGAGVDELEKLIDEVGNYNFDDASATNIKTTIDKLLSELKDSVSTADIANKARILKDKISKTKLNASVRKFTTKLIPFKDTDDDQWYTKYVSAVKNRGIVSGYKDKNGKELGEFRPGNNVTVAEILKIGLETSIKGESKDGNKVPVLKAAANHWAKGYVLKGEELGLDLVKGNASLDKPATRGEVVRMMLEALDIKPKNVSSTSFSDLSASHKDAAYIQYAADLGIVSGDSGKTTFRPDAPINRAEVSKIADLINGIIIGGWDSATSDGDDSNSATPINLP